MIDVQNLINNIKTITSKALCTWGEFITFLSTELQYFKQKGGIQVNPPEVVLPDGVTTTTLISQSEMTQFVTNTLNVWQAEINRSETPNLKNLFYPKMYNVSFANNPSGYQSLNLDNERELTVTWFQNYTNIINNILNPREVSTQDFGLAEVLNCRFQFSSSWVSEVETDNLFESNFVPTIFDFLRYESTWGYPSWYMFLTPEESLGEEFSNLPNLLQSKYGTQYLGGVASTPKPGYITTDGRAAERINFSIPNSSTPTFDKIVVFAIAGTNGTYAVKNFIPIYQMDYGSVWDEVWGPYISVAKVFNKISIAT